jgi:hypothetical protein
VDERRLRSLLADNVRFWFQIKKVGTTYKMSRSETRGCALDRFVRDRGIDPAAVPFLLNRSSDEGLAGDVYHYNISILESGF